MPDAIYVRKDDSLETVRILSQEKTPNGTIRFEFLSPPSAEGQTSATGAHVFHALYRDTRDKGDDKGVPKRPHSSATRDAWRDYALWLEREYAHVHVDAPTLTPVPRDWGSRDIDTLGGIGRRPRR